MAVELRVPSLGESIKEVILGQWLKKEGDSVRVDETLIELESDKATADFPAPIAGMISKLLKKGGETVAVGEIIGYIEPGPVPAGGKEKAPSSAASKAPPAASTPPAPKEAPPPKTPEPTTVTHVMPAAQRVLAEHQLQPQQVAPSGPGGRILKEDVLAHVQRVPTPVEPAVVNTAVVNTGGRQDEVVPMTTMRKRIAERLVQAKQNAALLTTFNEIDMSHVMELRSQYKEHFQKRYNIKLGFMSFFIKASVEALKLFPQINAEIRGNDIVYHNYFDIGVAVGGGKGLVVPIIRNAERMSFAEIELAIEDFGRRARENQLSVDELQGGTFTISNGGIYGSLLSTPIVNPPQSGILGLHAIQERPIALNGQVVIRPMMYVALTYDHRIVDGREAVTFLKRIKELMEEPARILLEV